MRKVKNFKSGLMMCASVVALGACTPGGESSVESFDEAVESFDGIKEGSIVMDYKVESDTYGDYTVNLEGDFEHTGRVVEESEESDSETGDAETTEEVESGEEAEVTETEESGDMSQEEDVAVSDGTEEYDYSLVESTSVYVDGKETKSSGEVVALDDTLFDKVFLTGSEADGKFVYDSRDEDITEYPLAGYLEVGSLIDLFDLEGSGSEVMHAELAEGSSGHVFTLTPEQVVTALQGDSGTSALGQNILGLASEDNVTDIEIGVNDTTFSVRALSNSGEDEESDSEQDTVVGYLTITKEESDVTVEAPSASMDVEEFSSLMELYYQRMAEEEMSGQIEDGEVYGDEAQEALESETTEESSEEESADTEAEQESENQE